MSMFYTGLQTFSVALRLYSSKLITYFRSTSSKRPLRITKSIKFVRLESSWLMHFTIQVNCTSASELSSSRRTYCKTADYRKHIFQQTGWQEESWSKKQGTKITKYHNKAQPTSNLQEIISRFSILGDPKTIQGERRQYTVGMSEKFPN